MTNGKSTGKQEAELEVLETMSDDDIDFSDIPETLDWSDAIYDAYEMLQTGAAIANRQETRFPGNIRAPHD